MIRVERDPAWWASVAAHPAVIGRLLGASPEAVGALALRPDIMPLAGHHGGFMFIKTDPMGFVCDLHVMFTPEGHGKEVAAAAKQAFNAIFICEYQAVTVTEVRANGSSRPPLSYGFVQCGDWRETAIGPARLWILTRAAWEASPANRRARNRLN